MKVAEEVGETIAYVMSEVSIIEEIKRILFLNSVNLFNPEKIRKESTLTLKELGIQEKELEEVIKDLEKSFGLKFNGLSKPSLFSTIGELERLVVEIGKIEVI